MYGKDLILDLSSKIVKVMGAIPLRLLLRNVFGRSGGKDLQNHGVTGFRGAVVDLRPGGIPVYFIFRDPRAAKKLSLEMIPPTMDEYLDHVRRYPEVPEEKKPDNPGTFTMPGERFRPTPPPSISGWSTISWRPWEPQTTIFYGATWCAMTPKPPGSRK